MPILPPEPAPPRPKKKGCGIIGQIISVVIAIVVTYLAGPVAGDAARQGFNIATGAQNKFSWKSLGITAITAGVAQGLPALKTGLGPIIDGAARYATANVITQGVSIATGLQKKFDWTGVAVSAAIGGFDGSGASRWLAKTAGAKGYFGDGVEQLSNAFAGAVTRSAIDGTDFGDALEAALPSAVAATIGFAVTDKIQSWNSRKVASPAIATLSSEKLEPVDTSFLMADNIGTVDPIIRTAGALDADGPNLGASSYEIASGKTLRVPTVGVDGSGTDYDLLFSNTGRDPLRISVTGQIDPDTGAYGLKFTREDGASQTVYDIGETSAFELPGLNLSVAAEVKPEVSAIRWASDLLRSGTPEGRALINAGAALPGAIEGLALQLLAPDQAAQLAQGLEGVGRDFSNFLNGSYSSDTVQRLAELAPTAAFAAAVVPVGVRQLRAGEISVLKTAGRAEADLPILEVSRLRTPGIAANIDAAIADGHPSILTRLAAKDSIRANRSAALRGQPKPASSHSLDEYPFASSAQGGAGARVAAVPRPEQHIQGGQISSFYQANSIRNGDSFLVKVVP